MLCLHLIGVVTFDFNLKFVFVCVSLHFICFVLGFERELKDIGIWIVCCRIVTFDFNLNLTCVLCII